MTAAVSNIPSEFVSGAAPLESVVRLLRALDETSVRYCHWKSNNALDKSAAGENDLDLLVDRADLPAFSEALARCGFKPARAPNGKRMPGVMDYFAYDRSGDKWVHVHAHYQLVLGHDLSKNYRIPIEEPYLGSAVRQGIFTIPAPEFEFILLVIRMMLKHATWDAILARERALKASERRELADLLARVDPRRVDALIERYLPYVGVTVFRNCLRALDPRSSIACRIRAAYRLERSLRAHARRASCTDLVLRVTRRLTTAVRRRWNAPGEKYRFAAGGIAIAVVGADGAGKSTAIVGLRRWLSPNFATTSVHMGKPRWSLTTAAARTVLKIGNVLGLYGVESCARETLEETCVVSAGYPWVIREVCRARDRYGTYIRGCRRAANGAVVFFDRFPLPQIELMDGAVTRRFIRDLARGAGTRQLLRPRADSRLVRFLMKLEEAYYQAITPPDLVIVLRVAPDTAVQRKPEEEERELRDRSTEIWNLDWGGAGAHIVDANACSADVLAELKELIWARL